MQTKVKIPILQYNFLTFQMCDIHVSQDMYQDLMMVMTL